MKKGTWVRSGRTESRIIRDHQDQLTDRQHQATDDNKRMHKKYAPAKKAPKAERPHQ